MADIWLLYCPRCLARLGAPVTVTEQIQLDRQFFGCGECARLTPGRADALYKERLAKARVRYTVPETYDIRREEA